MDGRRRTSAPAIEGPCSSAGLKRVRALSPVSRSLLPATPADLCPSEAAAEYTPAFPFRIGASPDALTSSAGYSIRPDYRSYLANPAPRSLSGRCER